MPKVQSRLTRFGIAKQADRDTAETNPTFAFGLTGGSILTPEVSEEDLNPTGDSRVVDGRERTGVVPGASFDALAVPKALGLVLLGALGTVATTDNLDGTYTHTFTVGDEVPYLTTFGRYDSNYYRVPGAKVSELGLSFDGPGAMSVSAGFQGLDMAFDGSSAFTPTNEEGTDNILRPAGGSITLDGQAASVTQGQFSIATGLTAVPTILDVTPEDMWAGLVKPTASLTLQPDNLDLFREVVTGSPTGDGVSNDVAFGSLSQSFTAPDGQTTLSIDAPRMAFAVSFPDANPEGGPASVPLEGVIVKPTDGSDPLTVSLTNTVASY